MAERVIKPKVKTGNNTSDDIKIPYNVLSNPPDLSVYAKKAELATVATSGSYNDLSNKPTIPTNYVTTDTAQDITGKKTVISPPNTDDSTQIANTAWVRENYQATCCAGRDSSETGTMYFKVASYTTVANYDHVSLIANLQDIDTPVTAQVVVRCSTSTSAYVPNAYIGVPTTSCSNIAYARYYAERLFVVANYTIGTASWTFELWLKTTDKNAQTIFNVVSQNSRKGTSHKRPWTLYNNVTTASGTADFSEESSDGRLVANDNYPYAVTVNYLQPHKDNTIDLGGSSAYWANGYIKQLQGVSVINGNGGNAIIQQKGEKGTTIICGSTGAPLALNGNGARPTYRQGASGTYANLALQSDIPPVPFDSTGLTTGTLSSTTLSAFGRLYVEKDVNADGFTCHIACVLNVDSLGLPLSYDAFVPIRMLNTVNFVRVYAYAVTETTYQIRFALINSSGATITNTAITSGTFKYKKLD